MLIKSVFILMALPFWYLSQKWLHRYHQNLPPMHDCVHEWTRKWNDLLQTKRSLANFFLISSSLLLDALTIFIMIWSVFGPSFRPFVALVILIILRQGSQALVTLPIPQGIVWRNPGFPSLIATYGISNDLFFSGHTALAVLGASELAQLGNPFLTGLGLFIVIYEIVIVLVLRAHWTIDVICAIFAAFAVDFGLRLLL